MEPRKYSAPSHKRRFLALRKLSQPLKSAACQLSANVPQTSSLDVLDHCKLMDLPNEVLSVVAVNLDHKSSLQLRGVCHRLKDLIESPYCTRRRQPIDITANRLVVTVNVDKKCYQLRWISYEKQTSKVISLSRQDIFGSFDLSFAFRKLKTGMIFFERFPAGYFTLDFVNWFMKMIAFCKEMPTELCMKKIDFSQSKIDVFRNLLSGFGNQIRAIELLQLCGVHRDMIIDNDITPFVPNLRRITVQDIRFQQSFSGTELRLGDGLLKKLASENRFPSLILERCAVSSSVLCKYSQAWLETTKNLRDGFNTKSQLCTLRHCRGVSAKKFTAECKKQNLQFLEKDLGEAIKMYSVRMNTIRKEFTVSIDCALDDGPAQKVEDIMKSSI